MTEPSGMASILRYTLSSTLLPGLKRRGQMLGAGPSLVRRAKIIGNSWTDGRTQAICLKSTWSRYPIGTSSYCLLNQTVKQPTALQTYQQ